MYKAGKYTGGFNQSSQYRKKNDIGADGEGRRKGGIHTVGEHRQKRNGAAGRGPGREGGHLSPPNPEKDGKQECGNKIGGQKEKTCCFGAEYPDSGGTNEKGWTAVIAEKGESEGFLLGTFPPLDQLREGTRPYGVASYNTQKESRGSCTASSENGIREAG